jgi:hypothetical protein
MIFILSSRFIVARSDHNCAADVSQLKIIFQSDRVRKRNRKRGCAED